MIQGDEITESAKAAQEIAKAAQAGISATEKLASFVGRCIGGPVDELSGIVTDRLKYFRWERQQRLIEKAEERVAAKNLTERADVPPKLLFPILEHASIEENNELQDRWAELIASAVDPAKSASVRSAFISILSELELTDVHILDRIYRIYRGSRSPWRFEPEKVELSHWSIVDEDFEIEWNDYKVAIDNLLRVNCVTFYVEPADVDEASRSPRVSMTPTNRPLRVASVTDYKRIALTSLGRSFVVACSPTEEAGDADAEFSQ